MAFLKIQSKFYFFLCFYLSNIALPYSQKFPIISLPNDSNIYTCEILDSLEDLQQIHVKQILDSLDNNSIKDAALMACCLHKLAIYSYFNEDDLIQSINYNKKAEQLRLKFDDGLLWRTYLNIGVNYYDIDEYKLAVQYFLKALYSDDEKDNSAIITLLKNLGRSYAFLGDFEKGIEFGELALKHETKTDVEDINDAKCDLAATLLETNEPKKIELGIQYLKQVLKDTKYEETKDIALNNLGRSYEALKNHEQALHYYEQVLNSSKKDTLVYSLMLSNITVLNKDNDVNNKEHYQEAIHTLNKSLELYTLYHDTEYHYDYAMPYENLGDANTLLKQFDTALLYYQKSLINLTNNSFIEEDIFKNPNPKDTILFIYSSLDMIRVLDLKATAAYLYYKQNDSLKYLSLADQCYQTAFDFHNQLQQDISTENSRLFQVKNIVPYIENALMVAYYLQERGQNVGKSAFRIMEKNKATVLLQSMNEADALKYTNLPDSLLTQEKDLKIAIIFHQKQLNEAIEYEDTFAIERLSKLLFEEKQEYCELIDDLEKNHPKYYRLKYQQNQTKLTDVQNQLNNKTALLSYFVGVSSIYSLLILKDSTRLFKIQKPAEWKKLIKNFQETISLSNPEERFNKYNKKSFIKFINNAHTLYQHLLKKPLAGLNHISNLKIIPDAELNYIPFELLFADINDTTSVNYKNLPYLLKQKTISYAYSAALMMEQKQAKASTTEKNYEYGGYTPIYSDTIYSDLPKARQLVNNMASFFKGKEYLNEQATKASFLKDTLSYQILHLAMHGKLKNQYPLNSHLVFTKSKNDTVEDSYQLYASDLYLHQLDTDLTILNACETGTGKLHKGEGVMSLSRAFTYAGCPSLMMSLWSIDEQPSAEILETFLKSIKKGNLKDVALRQAKLDYLNNTKTNLSHPYYWAGLVLTGNTEAMEFKYSLSEFWWVLGLFLILAGGYWASKIPSNKISHSKEISK